MEHVRIWARRLLVGAGIIAVGIGFVGYVADDGTVGSPLASRIAHGEVDSILPSLAPSLVSSEAVAEVDHNATGREGGELPRHATPFDTHLPGVANLDAALLIAVQAAARDAAEDGVPFWVTSGWRSAAYQQQLLDEAVEEYGGLEEARRFVATPSTSNHVTGRAVDIGPTDADSWLSQHGSAYGLCQTYANEMWHFELATEPGGVCPVMLSDASEMQ